MRAAGPHAAAAPADGARLLPQPAPPLQTPVATLAAHADRFTGGHAETAFGNVDIQGGPWNKEAELSPTYNMGRSSSATLWGNRRFTGFGAEDRVDLYPVHRF